MTKPKPKELHSPRGRPTDYDPAYCEQLVEFMRGGYSMTAFAGHIGVARSTLNVWAEAHPEFSEAVSRAKAARLLHWEEAALRVAQKGGGPGTATIIVFGLKNMAPEEYADRQQLEHTGKDGGPIERRDHPPIDPSKLSTDELEAFEALLTKARPDAGGSQGGAGEAGQG